MQRRILVVVVVLGVAGHAFADKRDLEAARAHYQSGAAYYQRGKYQDAIREFEQSYQLAKKPEILYNLAQCYDKLGEREKVVDYLKRYLKEKPRADDREQVMAWLSHLEKALAEERAAAERTAAEKRAAEERAAAERAAAERAAAEKEAAEKRAAAAQAAAERAAAERAAEKRAAAERTAAERRAANKPRAAGGAAALARKDEGTPRPDTSRGRWLRVTGYTAGSVGVVILALSLGPGLAASRKAATLEDQLNRSDADFSYDLQDKYRTGSDDAKLARGLVVVGTLGIVGGAVALYFGYRARRAERAVSLVPRPGGAGLAWSF